MVDFTPRLWNCYGKFRELSGNDRNGGEKLNLDPQILFRKRLKAFLYDLDPNWEKLLDDDPTYGVTVETIKNWLKAIGGHWPYRDSFDKFQRAVNPPRELVDLYELASSHRKQSVKSLLSFGSFHCRELRTFIGRKDELKEMRRVLGDQSEPIVVAIYGLAGMGKTALACQVARIVFSEGLFDYVVWIDAGDRSFDSGQIWSRTTSDVSYQGIIDDILRDTGHDLKEVLDADKNLVVKEFLQDNSVLLVIDNFESVENNDAILAHLSVNFGNASRVLITSRHFIAHPRSQYQLRLKRMTNIIDGRDFFREIGKQLQIPGIVELDEETSIGLFELCGGLPLAMRLVLGQMHSYSLEYIKANLQSANPYLPTEQIDYSSPETGDTNSINQFYRFMYEPSWEKLDNASKKILRILANFRSDAEIALADMENLCDLPYDDFHLSLATLIRFSLVDKNGEPGRESLSIHSMTRRFVLGND